MFDLGAYNRFLRDEADSIAAFKASQQTAFEAERERWRAAGHAEYVGDAAQGDADAAREAGALADTQRAIAADVSGSVWKVLVEAGERVTEGQVVAIVESMKMEVAVTATEDGTIETVDCAPGAAVVAGQRLMVMKAGAAEEVA